MEVREAFGKALRLARTSRCLTQEDFSVVSSRTNVSLLERGASAPTIEKLEDLCSVLDVHPVSLLAAAYLIKGDGPEGWIALLEKVTEDVEKLLGPFESK